MHTIEHLASDEFAYRCGDELVSSDAVMPSIEVEDRLGVVMGNPTDGVGAGSFVLSCVTRFYDRLRSRESDFYEYPDYYTFQTTRDTADYLELDVWPDHKNVGVPGTVEAILRAVNDRATTVLLVPEGRKSDPDLDEVTRNSARRRLDACYLYSPDGTLRDSEFSISLPADPAVSWFRTTYETVVDGERRFDGDEPFDRSPAGETVTQEFRRIGIDEALTYLPSVEGA